ncbi:putative RING-H2 finger protein ATL21A [Telopea speciosissima]|uniref:putative RING-H2 finger protein ATL21A n=1 Tax=Telopea speciosissima TaxID=54955 RepID=UPI001CC5CC5C|nr:putative RING-H2 finger protein ATL21A [Telopea speciosissima]
MVCSQSLSFFFLLLLLCHSVTVTGDEICPVFSCSETEPAIGFPFRINDLQPETCGYPGFDLTCTNRSRTILEISSSGGFWLQNIDYINQEIRVNDPDGCLPRRLLRLDLWDSPFRTALYQNYSMLRCSAEQGMPPVPYNPIGCLSNSTDEIWATASALSVDMMVSSRGCQVMTTVEVPIPWSGYYDNSALSFSDLSADLTLKWDEPQCGDCVEKGGRCAFKSSSSLEVECFGVSQPGGLSRSVSYAVTIGIGVPTLLGGIGIACYVSGRFKRYRRRNSSGADAAGSSSTVNPQPTVVAMGLDNPTIESYPKAVIGESHRLPRPNDNTCSICLSEYQPRETVRTIPQCQHCFHADCIDAWLRTNATCPICRNSPAPVLGAQPP